MSTETPIRFSFFYGKGAAGKDTQAELLLNGDDTAIRLSTGDLLRDAKDPENPYNEQLSDHIAAADKKGTLIPDDVIAKVVQLEVTKLIAEGKRRFIFTGFPRTVGQLAAVDGIINEMKEDYTIHEDHILFAILDRHSQERATTRREEAIENNLEPRRDDAFGVVEKRLVVYAEQTRPMLERLRDQGKLRVVRGNREIPAITESTLKLLNPETHMRSRERM